jgi:hypothetical protein
MFSWASLCYPIVYSCSVFGTSIYFCLILKSAQCLKVKKSLPHATKTAVLEKGFLLWNLQSRR